MHWQLSYYGGATDEIAVVTGPHKYRFLSLTKDNFTFPSEDGKKEEIDTQNNKFYVESIQGCGISSNYTCHAWTQDTCQLVVCTDLGDILLMNYDGSFCKYIEKSPRGY